MTFVTMNDIAKKVGVSKSTVSRVLSNTQASVPISENTRQKVLKAADELKFYPNVHARRFFGNKTEIIGLIIPSLTQIKGISYTFHESLLAELLSAIEDSVTINNYRLMLIIADHNFLEKKEYIDLARSKSADGFLLWGVGLKDKYVLELKAEEMPLILVNNHLEKNMCDFVGIDVAEGSFWVTEHLINLGHRQVAYIRGDSNTSVAEENEEGFKKALVNYGLNLDYIVEEGDFSEDSGYAAMKKLLDSGKDFTAIVAANDYMAIGAMRMIKEADLLIPDDIAVVGGDGVLLSSYVNPGLTTFKSPMYELGTMAVEKLLGLINNGSKKKLLYEILKPKLIIRQSSK